MQEKADPRSSPDDIVIHDKLLWCVVTTIVMALIDCSSKWNWKASSQID